MVMKIGSCSLFEKWIKRHQARYSKVLATLVDCMRRCSRDMGQQGSQINSKRAKQQNSQLPYVLYKVPYSNIKFKLCDEKQAC